jgi:hypothetical protein
MIGTLVRPERRCGFAYTADGPSGVSAVTAYASWVVPLASASVGTGVVPIVTNAVTAYMPWLVPIASSSGGTGWTINPTELVFNASADHEWVTAYEARYYIVAGGTAGLFDTQDLGVPTPVDGVITVAIDDTLFTPSDVLVYVAYIVAISDDVESEAGISNQFMMTS